MANRKVLINRHTSTSGAPIATEMYKGEIAVAHETGKETLWTKNNDNIMVPFISCAQTMTMINNAISAADVSYEVKKAEGEAFINVDRSVNGSAVTFTVSSEDIQSKAAFDEYSARTADAIAELIDDVLTGVTGDDIISATLNDPSTGTSNTVSLTHKKAPAAIATGFNKLATDAYGHVTASTAVATEDIQALGFKTSAETGAEIAALSAGTQHDIETLSGNVVEYVKVVSGNIETVINTLSADTEAAIEAAIEGLDSNSATTDNRHYVTAITIENGRITSFGEATDPQLSVESTGTGNVISQITVADHKISYTTTSVATSEAIAELSGAVETFSAATYNEFSSAFTAINDLSADTFNYVNAVSGNIESVILAMDKNADAVAGQVVTTISQTDGKVTETKENVKDLQLGGYVKNAAATGDIAGTDTINTALSKLENKVGANKITNADGSIVVTEPTGTATTTDVKVNIKSGEKVIKLDGEGGGLYTNLNLIKITESLPATIKERYEFRDSDNNKIGESIDIAKDSHIVSITYDEATQKLIYVYIDASGSTQTTEIDMSHLILETEVENGIQSINGKLSIKLDTTGDDTGDGKFLSVGANGLKLDGVTDAITAAVEALDYVDAAVAGQYVTEVDQTDGIIAVQRANVSQAPLNEYAKGDDATSVTSADTINGAVSKLENKIDVLAKATELELEAEVDARQRIDGQNSSAYTQNASTNYIASATSLNDADIKLDAAIKDIADAIADLDSSTATTDSGHYITAITITDGKITSAGQEALPAATPVTTVNGATGNTVAPVLTGIVTGGTAGHQLTLNYTNKVLSAQTADEAAHASAATKVDQKLTFADDATDVEYDGSSARTITFGTPVTATDITGRSMTITDGVVDVEIIDCGTY